jgi:hypothetical protein
MEGMTNSGSGTADEAREVRLTGPLDIEEDICFAVREVCANFRVEVACWASSLSQSASLPLLSSSTTQESPSWLRFILRWAAIVWDYRCYFRAQPLKFIQRDADVMRLALFDGRALFMQDAA